MPRSDLHKDAMLRHLGAAYYESLHGRATGADVERALDTVEEGLNGTGAGGRRNAAHPDRPHRAGREANGARHPHGWSRRVSDVMTTTMVTVDRITPYKEVARVMAEHRISGLPVLKMGREVVGVVTQADLLREQARAARRLRASARRSWRPGGLRHPALTAGELMTSPAVTIGPDATVSAAARLFLRADADIAADIRRVLHDILLARPGENPPADAG